MTYRIFNCLHSIDACQRKLPDLELLTATKVAISNVTWIQKIKTKILSLMDEHNNQVYNFRLQGQKQRANVKAHF